MSEQTTKNEKKAGSFKRVFGTILLGCLFGVFAAVAFYSVDIVLDIVNPKAMIEERFPMFFEEWEEEENSIPSETPNAVTVEEVPEESVIYENTENLAHTQVNVAPTVTDVSEVAKAVMPAIVSIINEYTVVENHGYFGTYEEEYEASGTGIIVGENEKEIVLVTNFHVIEDADRLEITFVDGSTAEALVKGCDEEMDLAVLTIPLESLKQETLENIAVAVLGDSDNLKVGEPAIAIGNALGYGQSVTTGVISAVNRKIGLGDINGTFIQTDAAINPGNSGGALLNMKGEVIGINSSKIGGDAIEGMGYAIPITEAMPILQELMTKVVRTRVQAEDKGYVGITGISASDYVSYYGGKMPDGVYVEKVHKDTAANDAGIEEGDVITKFGDYTIESIKDLEDALWYYAAGEEVYVEFSRKDKRGSYKTMAVTLKLGYLEN